MDTMKDDASDDDQPVLTLTALPRVSVPDGDGYAIRLDMWARLRAMLYERCRNVGRTPNESRAIADHSIEQFRKEGQKPEEVIQEIQDAVLDGKIVAAAHCLPGQVGVPTIFSDVGR